MKMWKFHSKLSIEINDPNFDPVKALRSFVYYYTYKNGLFRDFSTRDLCFWWVGFRKNMENGDTALVERVNKLDTETFNNCLIVWLTLGFIKPRYYNKQIYNGYTFHPPFVVTKRFYRRYMWYWYRVWIEMLFDHKFRVN